MANLHGMSDTLREVQSICFDLLPACVIGTVGLTPPGSGLTLPAAGVAAYARRGADLLYLNQPALSVTVPNVAGAHWLAAHVDTHTPVTDWTRRPGSHWLTRQLATQPATPDGCVLVAQLTVAGGTITAVNPAVAPTPPLSRQTANAVAITGGTLVLPYAQMTTGIRLGDSIPPGVQLDVVGDGRLTGTLGVATGILAGGTGAPQGNTRVHVLYQKSTKVGLFIAPTDNDTGTVGAIVFGNVSGGVVGEIVTTATATSYNTTSDVRLKHAVQALGGALEAVRALRPVRFRWNADESADEGFLAHELQQVLPHAVSGTPEAVNDDGSVRPQGVDHSKLVPWLVGAVQALAAQVEALTARVQSLEEQLGL